MYGFACNLFLFTLLFSDTFARMFRVCFPSFLSSASVCDHRLSKVMMRCTESMRSSRYRMEEMNVRIATGC